MASTNYTILLSHFLDSSVVPLSTYKVCEYLESVMQYLDKPSEQFSLILHAAIHQRNLGSWLCDGDIKGSYPTIQDKCDLPFATILKYPDVDDMCVGWPVNFAVYNNEVYLHFKYLGLELSSKEAGDDDFLMPFTLYEDRETNCEAIRAVYVMVRNMLNGGLMANHLMRVATDAVNNVKSPFATCQNMTTLPLNIARLVAPPHVVNAVLQSGVCESMDEDCMATASMLHDILVQAN